MICNCFDIIKRSAENGTIGTTEEKNRDWCKWRFGHHLCHQPSEETKRISDGRNTRNHQSMDKTELKAGIRLIPK